MTNTIQIDFDGNTMGNGWTLSDFTNCSMANDAAKTDLPNSYGDHVESGYYPCYFYITLVEPGTVDSITLYGRRTGTDGGLWPPTITAELYNQYDTKVADSTLSFTSSPSGWLTRTDNVSVQDVYKIKVLFYAGKWLGSPNVLLELDYLKLEGDLTIYAIDTPEHTPPPALGYCRQADVFSINPIDLRNGNKVLEEYDFQVETPAGPLSFVRSYKQDKQADFDFMGLGWTHNHIYELSVTGTSPDREAEVLLPGGGNLKLVEVTTNNFEALPGSSATMEHDTTNHKYILTAPDESVYTFCDGNNPPTCDSIVFESRQWPGGEEWTYAYDGSNRLTEIDDGYGRKLKFGYISNPSGYDDGKLLHVGDHTASGLGTGSPSGRYIKFTYTPEKSDGSVIGSPGALLASVDDVQGETWTYDYYGQSSGETDSDLLNFLLERASPQVDTTGNNTPDTSLVLESLAYTMNGSAVQSIVQERGGGLVETTFVFPQGNNLFATETVAGKTITHHFRDNNGAPGTYLGTDNPAGEGNTQYLNESYRPVIQTDARGNETLLAWSDDGKLLEVVTDALDNDTQFFYDAYDRLDYSLDAEGRKTRYTYGDGTGTREPTVVEVFDGVAEATLLQKQTFTYNSKRHVTQERTLDPSDGTTVVWEVNRAYYSSGEGEGFLETMTQEEIGGSDDVTTTYLYDTAGRVIQVNQSSNFGSCSKSRTIYDAAGNAVASICNYDPEASGVTSFNSSNPPTTATEAETLQGETTDPDVNRVTTYAYDTMGRRILTITEAGRSYARKSLTVYDALGRVVRAISNYDPTGVASPYTAVRTAFDHGTDYTKNLITDMVYNERGMVRKQVDITGNVILYGYDDAGRLVRTVQSASDPDYDSSYGTGGDPELIGYIPNGEPDEDIVSVSSYDANGNLIKTVDALGRTALTGYDELNRVVRSIQSASDPDYDIASDPGLSGYTPGSDPDQDLSTVTMYDKMGRVRRSDDPLGNATLYGYDLIGRQVKVVRSASDPDYDYDTDPDLSGYSESGNVDKDLISTTTYADEGYVEAALDVLNVETRFAYDGLGRQIQTIAGYETGSSSDPDKDLISETFFDADGRVWKTTDPLDRATLYGYDDFNRQVRVIRNASNPTYNTTGDPDLSSYSMSSNSDEDIYTDTIYDDQGRVWKTIDHRGNETRHEYDALGRRTQTAVNYVNGVYDSQCPDEDLITTTEYDLAGRVTKVVDPAGIETRYSYDALGRRAQTVVNYVNGVYDSQYPDEDLISTTVYNKVGQVVSTTDARGTRTDFTYDAAGRRLTTTQAAGSRIATTTYACYDRAGRVLRTIRNWVDNGTSPDEQISGVWQFDPDDHGVYNDTNLITTYELDALGRVTSVADPAGNTVTTDYDKAGRIVSRTDPGGSTTEQRYDRAGRLTRTVQGYLVQGQTDPADWEWVTDHWEDGDSNTISHSSDSDRNIIADTTYDKGGRRTSLRDPRGNLTSYEYDDLNRRTKLTNPLSHEWDTAYTEIGGGEYKVTLTDPLSHDTERVFDRLGRLSAINYLSESPKNTPNVSFTYNAAGNRISMVENDGTQDIRTSSYTYDDMRRLTEVDVDSEVVSYVYDTGGLRTSMTIPGDTGTLSLSYTYNDRGRLIRMTDWDGHQTDYRYDRLGRVRDVHRSNDFDTRYRYDTAGHLVDLLHHRDEEHVMLRLLYELDGRGNRTQIMEVTPDSPGSSDTYSSDDPRIVYNHGRWSQEGSYMVSTDFDASLWVEFFGTSVILTLGRGPDHGISDIYVDGVYHGGYDGFYASSGDTAITLDGYEDTVHVLEIRNRYDKNLNPSATGYKLRLKTIETQLPQAVQTITYAYDQLARLQTADYYEGIGTGGSQPRDYDFTYDRAGNRTQQSVTVNSVQTITGFGYNNANQLSSSQMDSDPSVSYTYDNNGNLTHIDSNETYRWDRANRLLGGPTNGSSGYDHAYNGLGQRVYSSTWDPIASTSISYLLDTQPGLYKVVARTDTTYQIGHDPVTKTSRYIHDVMGFHSQEDHNGDWSFTAPDHLGSVRAVFDESLNEDHFTQYAPYGDPFGSVGSNPTPYGFTGEPTDSNGLVHLRARYYNPGLASFINLDPLETDNRYGYVSGNPINRVDPNGLQGNQSGEDRGVDCISLCQDYCRSGGSTSFGTPADPYPYLYTCEESCLYTCRGKPDPFFTEAILPGDPPNFNLPTNPCTKPYTSTLYLEGFSPGGNVGVGGVGGTEIVFDFATMESARFTYWGLSLSGSIGVSGGLYFGFGSGFTLSDSYSASDRYTAGIIKEYSGSFVSIAASASIIPLLDIPGEPSAAVARFSSTSGYLGGFLPPYGCSGEGCISGYYGAVGIGAGVSLPINVTGAVTQYSYNNGTYTRYVYEDNNGNKKVQLRVLLDDIDAGLGTINIGPVEFGVLGAIPVEIRERAKRMARDWTKIFETRSNDCPLRISSSSCNPEKAFI